MSKFAANEIAALINKNNKIRLPNGKIKPTVLGFATGNTPVGIYDELVRMHKEDGLDFSHVITFNLDEYYGRDSENERNLITADHPKSFRYFMEEHLFKNLKKGPGALKDKNINFLDGTVGVEETDDAKRKKMIEKHCERYQTIINKVGGIQLQIVGLGPKGNGHIAFNEPRKDDPTFSLTSGTRLITLSQATKDANPERPTDEALTMGLGDIMKCKRILVIASNKAKTEDVVYDMLEAPYNAAKTPAAILRYHRDCTALLADGTDSKLKYKPGKEVPYQDFAFAWSRKVKEELQADSGQIR